ncbi:MAG TPA: iron-sulfur cluster carrier protein ApbC [Methylococcaceae bacterium]|nr:iron-sulfur cluster carrier protein ApbC [Methylococcaceae bacterium]
MTKEEIESHLRAFIEPHYGVDLLSAKAVKSIEIQDGAIFLAIELGYASKHYWPILNAALTAHLQSISGGRTVQVDINMKIACHGVQQKLKPLPNVKNILAVASGKGGVGKSTTAVNLALALARDGARVGILDADIYGPSIPMMLGLSGKPESLDNKTMQPKVAFGVQTMSIGYLVPDDQALIWRGPMVTNALQQLLKETQWEALDYLVMDLPPGTGDIQLTLAQTIPVSGAIIVSTPQDIALLDAQRGFGMFDKVSVPVLGIVENMSLHICRHCGHEEAIFGSGGGMAMADINKIDCLGQLPLDITIRQLADSGRPIVVEEPEGRIAQMYQDIARKMAAKLALKPKDFSSKFPSIVVQN